MSFVVIKAGTFAPANPLVKGQTSLGRNGTLLAFAEDLARVGITNYGILLADPDNSRLGLRAVREGEEQGSVACSVVMRKGRGDSGRRRVNVGRALKALDLKPEDCCGRREWIPHGNELLYIVLERRPPQKSDKGRKSK